VIFWGAKKRLPGLVGLLLLASASTGLAIDATPHLYEGEKLKAAAMPASGSLDLSGWTKSGRAVVYSLPVKAGQSYEIKFDASSKFAYLVIFDLSDPEEEAIFGSDTDGRTARLKAKADTTWLIRPYFARNAPRRGLGVHFTVKVQAVR
jgi:hypothetical protein